MISKENTEVLIITSNIKYIPEFNKNLIAASTETRNKNFLLNIIQNIKQHTHINNFLIIHDLKIDHKDSLIYQNQLEIVCKKKRPKTYNITIKYKNTISNFCNNCF